MNVIPLKSDAYVRYVCIFFNWFQPSWRANTCVCKHSGAVDPMHVNVACSGLPCSPAHGIMLLACCFCVAWRWRCGFISAWFSIWCNLCNPLCYSRCELSKLQKPHYLDLGESPGEKSFSAEWALCDKCVLIMCRCCFYVAHILACKLLYGLCICLCMWNCLIVVNKFMDRISMIPRTTTNSRTWYSQWTYRAV